MSLSLILILSAIIGTKSILLPELDEKYYDIFLNEGKLFEHNKKQNIECKIEDTKLDEFTDHNFNSPVSKQVEDKRGFYQSVVFINQEIEYAKNQLRLNYCLGLILNEVYVLTFTNCLKKTKLQTVIKYGALSNNCTGCPITTAKRIISEKDISLIHLRFPIKLFLIFDRLRNLNVGPACISNLSNRNLSFLSWSLHVTHGLNEENKDHLFHKPVQFGQIGKQLITISYSQDKVISESFIFKAINDKLFVIGLCDVRKYEHYYCYNINKYKKFISDTINDFKSSKARSLIGSQWRIFNLEDTGHRKKSCS